MATLVATGSPATETLSCDATERGTGGACRRREWSPVMMGC
jgi:hypothetical protein